MQSTRKTLGHLHRQGAIYLIEPGSFLAWTDVRRGHRYVKAKIIQHVNNPMVIYGALSYFPQAEINKCHREHEPSGMLHTFILIFSLHGSFVSLQVNLEQRLIENISWWCLCCLFNGNKRSSCWS